jgi:DNA-binding HxlR family transcriptional regulator
MRKQFPEIPQRVEYGLTAFEKNPRQIKAVEKLQADPEQSTSARSR